MTLDELLATDRAVIQIKEAAGLLECDERTVSRAINDGTIPSIRVGKRRLIPVQRLIPLLTDVPTTESGPGAPTPGHATTESANGGPTHDHYDTDWAQGLRAV